MAVKTKTVGDRLRALGACDKAVAWARNYTSDQEAWDACERGDWLLWLIGTRIDCGPWTAGRKPFLLCALDCAETVKHLWPTASKEKIADAIAVMRGWANGTETLDRAKKTRESLYAAAYAAYAADAAAAAADVDVDDAAAYVAAAAAYAAYAADARIKNQKQTVKIVRKHYPHPPE